MGRGGYDPPTSSEATELLEAAAKNMFALLALYQLSYLPKFASVRAHLHRDFSFYFVSLKLDFEESFIARHLAKLRDYNPFAAPLVFD